MLSLLEHPRRRCSLVGALASRIVRVRRSQATLVGDKCVQGFSFHAVIYSRQIDFSATRGSHELILGSMGLEHTICQS